MLFTVLLIIHVLICVALVIVVLMQSAKGEGLAGAFGGGAITGAVFGGRGAASFLSKATTVLAIVFMMSCLVLSLLSSGRGTASVPTDSAVARTAQEQAAQQQAVPQEALPQEGEAGTPEDIFPEGQQQEQATPEDIFNQQQQEPATTGEGSGP
jgi:preprotein translocase subunit SecG